MIGRVLAVVTELAFASNWSSNSSSNICLDLLLNNHLRRLRSWLLHHHRLLHHHAWLLLDHSGLLHHHTGLLHHHAWLLLDHAWLLHHHRLLLLHHAWLGGHLNHARLSWLACNTHHDRLLKGLVRGRLCTVVD